ncbi:MAG: DUF3800 domain-containing protein [Methanoregula sp.]|nr:DUF3800 domain-containing protein [Methanoregula sp.]
MTIYYAFGDESGHYQTERTEKNKERNPYYVRATLLMLADDWKILNSEFLTLKKNWGFSRDEEIKWDYIWKIKWCQENGKKPDKDIAFLMERFYDENSLVTFVENALILLRNLDFFQIIITITDNRICNPLHEKNILQTHLQKIMQRIQMELQSDQENLAVIFFDSINEKKDKALCEAYSSIYHSGDFIKEYSCIQDCLHFEQSNQSVGIQLADYVAGITMNRLRQREESVRLFNKYIFPALRRSDNGNLMGFGVIDIPRNEKLRHQISQLLEGACND